MNIINIAEKTLYVRGRTNRNTPLAVDPTENIDWANLDPADTVILCEDDMPIVEKVEAAGRNVSDFFDAITVKKPGEMVVIPGLLGTLYREEDLK